MNINSQDRSVLFAPYPLVDIYQPRSVSLMSSFFTGRSLWVSSGWAICRCLRFSLIDSAAAMWRSPSLSPACALTSLEPLELAELKRHSSHFLSKNEDIFGWLWKYLSTEKETGCALARDVQYCGLGYRINLIQFYFYSAFKRRRYYKAALPRMWMLISTVNKQAKVTMEKGKTPWNGLQKNSWEEGKLFPYPLLWSAWAYYK